MSSHDHNDSQKDQLPTLGATGRDQVVSGMRALAGMAPVVGPVLSEVIGEVIPQQRQERLEAYVKALEARIEHIEQTQIEEKFQNTQNVDLFEEGVFQAARALSQDRIGYIAHIVANGISGEEKEQNEAKRLLAILSELEDDQIIRLTSYLHKNQQDTDFRERHEDLLQPIPTHFQSSREELDRASLRDAAFQQLTRMGLLRPRFKKPKKNELPELDEKTGMMKAQGYDITPLGRLLLRYAGLSDPEDM